MEDDSDDSQNNKNVNSEEGYVENHETEYPDKKKCATQTKIHFKPRSIIGFEDYAKREGFAP